MLRASEARQEAREALNGKWQKAFLITLFYTLFTMAITFLLGFFGVLAPLLAMLINIGQFVIMPPLIYGINYSYYHLKNGENVEYGDFLKVGFKNFKRSWGIAWGIFCKCWYLIVIPLVILIAVLGLGIMLYSASTIINTTTQQDYLKSSYSSTSSYYDYLDNYYDNYYNYNYDYNNDYNYNHNYDYDNTDELVNSISAIVGASVGAILITIIVFAIYITVIVLFIRKILLYSLTYYIAVENETMTPKEAILESERLMNGNRGRLFCLMLSFFGWALLVSFSQGVLTLIPVAGVILAPIASIVGMSFLSPYVVFSILAFYKDLKYGNNNFQYANVEKNEPIQNPAMQSIVNVNQLNNENINISSKKFCKRCGAANTLDATYCTTCGAKLD